MKNLEGGGKGRTGAIARTEREKGGAEKKYYMRHPQHRGYAPLATVIRPSYSGQRSRSRNHQKEIQENQEGKQKKKRRKKKKSRRRRRRRRFFYSIAEKERIFHLLPALAFMFFYDYSPRSLIDLLLCQCLLADCVPQILIHRIERPLLMALRRALSPFFSIFVSARFFFRFIY